MTHGYRLWIGVIVGAFGYPALATFAALLAAAVVVAGTVTRRHS